MAVINAINSTGFFWDHRTQKLEDMVLQPIKHQVEMGLDNTDFLIKKLGATSFYPRLFNEAFGSPDITRENIGKALAQFLYSMFGANSKADQAGVINGGGWGGPSNILSSDEQLGAQLFQQKGCTNCHAGSNLRGWGDDGFENIGLDAVYADRGLGALLNDPTKDGQFKIPSLRNVGLTAPYMHDGRYKTLEEVVDHYNSGIIYSNNLSMMLRARDPQTYQFLNEPVRMNMSDNDKRCLVAFLRTLTDASITSDPKFSDPFKK
jgi:cytochrome c peroxidase